MKSNLKSNTYYFRKIQTNFDNNFKLINTYKQHQFFNNFEKIKQSFDYLVEKIEKYSKSKEQYQKQDIIFDIFNFLISTKDSYINYHPFCLYFTQFNYSFTSFLNFDYENKEQKLVKLKKILESYVENRHYYYTKEEGYKAINLIWLLDYVASKRNSVIGIHNLSKELEKRRFIEVNSLEDFNKNTLCYTKPDKSGKNLFNQILQQEQIDFLFKKENSNKYPDLLIKISEKILILEHKLTNNQGGSQNSQVAELIRFISYKEKNPNIFYIACQEGNIQKTWFNRIKNSNFSKNKVIYQDIIKTLEQNKQSYFTNLNTFVLLLEDILRNSMNI